jgi:hypothetical protein
MNGHFYMILNLGKTEAALRQHILPASFQTKVWHASCLAKPPLPSPMEYEWRTVKDSLHHVYDADETPLLKVVI